MINKIFPVIALCLVSACLSQGDVVIQPNKVETETYVANIENISSTQNGKNLVSFDFYITNKLDEPRSFALSDIVIRSQHGEKKTIHIETSASYLKDSLTVRAKETVKMKLYFSADQKSKMFNFSGLSSNLQ